VEDLVLGAWRKWIVCLYYTHIGTENASSSSVNQGVEDGNIATGREPSSDNSLFTLSEVDTTLAGGETTVSLPRLEGVMNNLPSIVYAGNLQRLSLELRNSSEISVKIHDMLSDLQNHLVINLLIEDQIKVKFLGISWTNDSEVTFEAGLVSDETVNSYKWLLQSIRKAFLTDLQVVVTDQDASMKQAIKTEFPNARHSFKTYNL
ncbi:FAR1-related sequence 5-like protein, partial [Tanacetum coccineum]